MNSEIGGALVLGQNGCCHIRLCDLRMLIIQRRSTGILMLFSDKHGALLPAAIYLHPLLYVVQHLLQRDGIAMFVANVTSCL